MILFVLFFLSCSENEQSDTNTKYTQSGVKIDISKSVDFAKKATDVFTFSSILPLSFSENTLLSGIDKGLLYNDDYYLMDQKFSAIYRFSKNGAFINAIGKLGSGPGEYKGLQDFIIDSSGRIITLSNNDLSIFYYNLDGTFIKKVKTNIFASQFCEIATDRFLFYTNFNPNIVTGNNNLIETDSLGKINKKLYSFNRENQNMSISFSGFLTKTASKIFFTTPFTDTIFSISPNLNSEPEYVINFGSTSLQKDRKFFSKIISKKVLLSPESSWLEKDFIANGQFAVISFASDKKINTCVYDIAKAKYTFYNKSYGDGLLRLLNMPICISGNELTFAISAESVINVRSNKALYESIKTDWPILYQQMEKTTINDNYFLLKLKLK